MAARKDFTIYRGTAPRLVVGPIRDRHGAIVDVTGREVSFTMREYASDVNPPSLSVEGEPLTPGADGYVAVQLAKADTIGLALGDYAYAVTLDDAPEDVTTIGVVTVKPNVKDVVT